MTDKQPKSEVDKLLNKTHEQVGLAPEEKKIQFAKENAGFIGWISASLGQLRPEHFRAMIEEERISCSRKERIKSKQMQYLLIGKDDTSPEASERRQDVRQAHINLGSRLLKEGSMWYGAALLDDNNNMIGSVLMLYFKTEEELKEYLEIEPYITQNVWKSYTIQKM